MLIGHSCRWHIGRSIFTASFSTELMTPISRGETGVGKWSVVVKDTIGNEFNGTFTDWRLTLWGECIDPSIQEPLPMPTENDDDDHDAISDSPTVISVDPVDPQNTGMPALPSDHQHRPVNVKPTASEESPNKGAEPTASAETSSDASGSSTSLPDTAPSDASDSNLQKNPSGEDLESDHLLSHYFPTFRVSKRTQIWIYGAFTIIVLFCASLGMYFFYQRRKRRRSEREDYEFEMIEDDEGMKGKAGQRTKRRGGELYDAFAGESDEEGLLSEDDDAVGGYRDEAANEMEETRGRKQPKRDDEKV